MAHCGRKECLDRREMPSRHFCPHHICIYTDGDMQVKVGIYNIGMNGVSVFVCTYVYVYR